MFDNLFARRSHHASQTISAQPCDSRPPVAQFEDERFRASVVIDAESERWIVFEILADDEWVPLLRVHETHLLKVLGVIVRTACFLRSR